MNKIGTRGFTLVELVVVITILGILAAFAVPRFLALDTQARTAAVQALAGSIRSSAALTHSMSMANGGAAVVMEGNTITMAFTYPDAAATGIPATLADTSGFSYATGVFSKTGAPTPANCSVTYTAAAAANTAPTIAVTTTGC